MPVDDLRELALACVALRVLGKSGAVVYETENGEPAKGDKRKDMIRWT
jgi:hypothetical protein